MTNTQTDSQVKNSGRVQQNKRLVIVNEEVTPNSKQNNRMKTQIAIVKEVIIHEEEQISKLVYY